MAPGMTGNRAKDSPATERKSAARGVDLDRRRNHDLLNGTVGILRKRAESVGDLQRQKPVTKKIRLDRLVLGLEEVADIARKLEVENLVRETEVDDLPALVRVSALERVHFVF